MPVQERQQIKKRSKITLYQARTQTKQNETHVTLQISIVLNRNNCLQLKRKTAVFESSDAFIYVKLHLSQPTQKTLLLLLNQLPAGINSSRRNHDNHKICTFKRLQGQHRSNEKKICTSCPVAAASAEIRLVFPTPGLPSRSTAFRT